jgi:hypothetical protein
MQQRCPSVQLAHGPAQLSFFVRLTIATSLTHNFLRLSGLLTLSVITLYPAISVTMDEEIIAVSSRLPGVGTCFLDLPGELRNYVYSLNLPDST